MTSIRDNYGFNVRHPPTTVESTDVTSVSYYIRHCALLDNTSHQKTDHCLLGVTACEENN
jgi:hypothetical protein